MRARPRHLIGVMAVTVALAAGVGVTRAAADDHVTLGHEHTPGHDHAGRLDPVGFGHDMRKLWEDHVTWTRLFIVSAVADLPDAGPTAARLLQNQADIGHAVAAFYGDGAGATLTDLLRQHILIAADLVAAAKGGDTVAVAAQRVRWYANADEIAAFLAAANPRWPQTTLQSMMRTHLDQTLDEATARLSGDWAGDIAAYERIHLHILEMADTLAAGIVAQFPKRFTR